MLCMRREVLICHSGSDVKHEKGSPNAECLSMVKFQWVKVDFMLGEWSFSGSRVTEC